MKEALNKSPLGILLLVLWLPTLSSLSPLPHQSLESLRASYQSKSEQSPNSATRDSQTSADLERQMGFMKTKVWLEWVMLFFFSLLGIVSAVMAILRTRYWSFLVLVMSVLFLIGFVLQYQSFDRPILDSWIRNAQAVFYVGGAGSIGSFLWGNLVQPMAFITIALYLLYYTPGEQSK